MTRGAPATPPAPARAAGTPRTGRVLRNRVFLAVCVGATGLSVLILAVLIAAVFIQGWKYLDADFLTNFPSRRPADAGLKAALWGSVWICAVCAVVAIPIGVGTAILLEEFKPRGRILRRLHGFVQLNISNLAGVPSIVYGILGLTVFVRMFGLMGSPNLALYDEMLRIRTESGEVIQADLAEETDTTLAVQSPLRGRLEFAKSDLRSVTRIYVRSHTFRLDDGRTIRGTLREHDDRRIIVDDDAGAEHIFTPAEVRSYDSLNFFQIGNPDSFFYFRLPLGGSVMAGGLTLALVVLPLVIIASREALRAVPDSLREGAFALGTTRWQMVSRMILPASIPGIMTGAILAMSRAIGEAAPLLVVGGFLFIMLTPRNVMDDFAALPLQIFNWAGRPQEEFHKVAATGIIVLLGVLFLFNAAAILVRHKFQRPLQ